MRTISFSKSIAIGAMLALCGLSACSKKSSNASTITLTLPDFSRTESSARSEKNQLSTMSTSTKSYVSRVMLNVRGSDIPTPIFYVAQSHDSNKPIPSSIQITVPSGSNRLIQALLVVKTVTLSATGSELGEREEKFYYGDVTKSLSGDDSVDLTLTSVTTTPGAQGAIAGRLIDAATSNGPTGRVNVQFAPPNGSPAMTVMETEIHGGWFNFMAFEGLPFKYVMRDGRVLVPDMNIGVQPTAPGTKLGYVVVPSYFDAVKDGNTEVERVQKPGNKYLFGYFGDGVPASNKFCYDSSSALSLNDAYLNATANDTSKVGWAGNGLPTGALAGVKAGGSSATGANCGGVDYSDDFHINVSELASHDRFVDYSGPFKPFLGNDGTKKLLDVYLDGTHVNVAWKFLPGVVGPARVTSVGVYTRILSAAAAATPTHGDPDYMIDGNVQCDRLTDPSFLETPFTFQTALQASPLIVNNLDLGAIANASDLSNNRFQVVACPINDFGLHKFTSAIGSGGGGSSNSGSTSATQLIVRSADNHLTSAGAPKLAKDNICFPVVVQAADASSNPSSLSSGQTLNLALTGDANVSVHYKSDCTDNPTGPFSVPGFNRDALIFIKTTGAATDYQINFSAATVTGATYFGRPAIPTAPYTLVTTITPNLYAHSCEPIRFTAVGANGALSDLMAYSLPGFDLNLASSTLHYYQEQDGTCTSSTIDFSGFQIPPSGSTAYARVKYYAAGEGTSISLLPTSGGMTGAGGIISPVTTTVHQPGAPARIQFMLGDHQSSELCQPFTAMLVDANNRTTTNNTGSPIVISLSATGGSSTFNYSSGSNCSVVNGSPSLTINTSDALSGYLGFTPTNTGTQTVSGTISSGALLPIDSRMVTITPAIANRIQVVMGGETWSAGTLTLTGTPKLYQAMMPMQITLVARTPLNNIDTNFNINTVSGLNLHTSSGTPSFGPITWTSGVAQFLYQPDIAQPFNQVMTGGGATPFQASNGSPFRTNPQHSGVGAAYILATALNACQPILLSGVDAFLNQTQAARFPTIEMTSFTSNFSRVSFFTDADCTNLTTGESFSAGSYVRTAPNPLIYYRVNATNYDFAISGSGTGVGTGANNPASGSVGPAQNLKIVSLGNATSSIYAETCQPFLLMVTDANGNAALPSASMIINVTKTSAGSGFHYNSDCSDGPWTNWSRTLDPTVDDTKRGTVFYYKTTTTASDTISVVHQLPSGQCGGSACTGDSITFGTFY